MKTYTKSDPKHSETKSVVSNRTSRLPGFTRGLLFALLLALPGSLLALTMVTPSPENRERVGQKTGEDATPAAKSLADDREENVEKLEIRHSMLGYRDTLVFYTFKEQRAIMVIQINNKDETFPVTGNVHLFDKTTTEKGLKKWINNQHSDGIYVDVPKPIFTTTLPAGFYKITSRKQTGTSENPGVSKKMYKDFELALSIKAQDINGQFTLPAFTDTVQVHVERK